MKLRFPTLLLLAASLSLLSCKTTKHVSAKSKHKYMERTYASLKDALKDLEVQMSSDTVKVIFNSPVMFAFNRAEIDPSQYPTIKSFAQVMLQRRNTTILIAGHTDSIGGDNEANMNLSLRRADSAKAVLHHFKIPLKRIETWGFGASVPVASNSTEEGRAKNRRIEIVVLYDIDGKRNK